VGEIIRRISRKSLKQFIADEIVGPLGADFTLGLPEKYWSRAAELVPPPAHSWDAQDPTSVAGKTFAGPPSSTVITATPGFRGAGIGVANGFSNARSLVRIGSMVSLNGTVDGKQYFSPGVIDRLCEEQISRIDLVTDYSCVSGLVSGFLCPRLFLGFQRVAFAYVLDGLECLLSWISIVG